ncbi:MAG: hypothetical protein ACI9XC_002050, partial [Gammaproteobacteria bacterium]
VRVLRFMLNTPSFCYKNKVLRRSIEIIWAKQTSVNII